MTYTYIFHYVGGNRQETVLRNCENRIALSKLSSGFLQEKTPTGTILINLANVTTIEEITNPVEPGDILK